MPLFPLPPDPDLPRMSDPKPKPTDGFSAHAVPKAVVSRLSLYLRELQHLEREGLATTSSTRLGRVLGLTDAQVRKDLAYFGQFGYPGIGYRCSELIAAIKRILGTDRDWPICLVGAGNLGRALLGYRGFGEQGFRVVAAFDIDPAKTGAEIDTIPVFGLDELPAVVARQGIQLGIVAVPGPAAQAVADKLVEAGVVGILNFAPVTLILPPHVRMVGVDLAIELEQLAFTVANRTNSSDQGLDIESLVAPPLDAASLDHSPLDTPSLDNSPLDDTVDE